MLATASAGTRAGAPPGLLRRWATATFLGETLGFAVPGIVGAGAYAAGLPDAAFVMLLVCAGTAEGAVLGFAQTVGMARELPVVPRRDWVRATAGAAAVAWAFGATAGVFSERMPLAAMIALWGVAGTVILLSIGTAQWLVLRRYVSNAGWWVPANAGAWLLGVGVVFAASSILTEDTQAAVIGLVAVLSGVAMAAIVAVVTGATLVWLVAEGQVRAR
jgi:hypothetical protein